MDLIFSLEPTFVARSFSGNIPQMTAILKEAVAHRGFAYVDILQACPTYNKFATHEWLLEHCYDASEEGHDPTDLAKAREIAIDTSERISTGILYRNEDVPNFHERLIPRKDVKTTAVEEVEMTDVSDLMKEFV
jgi:2-oxoglutarate ferredoxin oxidoreductase subunit beta